MLSTYLHSTQLICTQHNQLLFVINMMTQMEKLYIYLYVFFCLLEKKYILHDHQSPSQQIQMDNKRNEYERIKFNVFISQISFGNINMMYCKYYVCCGNMGWVIYHCDGNRSFQRKPPNCSKQLINYCQPSRCIKLDMIFSECLWI